MPERVEQLVVDDRVVHPHAALVEDADDRLLAAQLAGERRARARPPGRSPSVGRGRGRGSCRGRSSPVSSQSRRPLARPVVGEVLAPQHGVAHAGLGQARGEVEQADQPGPLAAPVGHDQDRAAVGAQPGQHVVAVLPHRLGDDERRVGRDALEDLDARALAVDEAVPVPRRPGGRAGPSSRARRPRPRSPPRACAASASTSRSPPGAGRRWPPCTPHLAPRRPAPADRASRMPLSSLS